VVTAMKASKPIIWILSVFALLLSGGVTSAKAVTTRHCTTEECACEEALKQNTIEALEAFLKKYPQSTAGGGTSACAALGVPGEEEGITGAEGAEESEPEVGDLSSGG
jgi:hypothetical protein